MPNSFNACIHKLQQKVARRGINYSLDRLKTALTNLHHPEQSLPTTIHIAGTNGKGSVAHYLTQAMIAEEHSVLTYTSPHIHSYTERFSLNGQPISDALFSDLFDHVNLADSNDALSEYEVLTLMAFVLANQAMPDYLILETGLGGRLDATNVIPKSIAVITDIGLDHCDILGPTISDIAKEKSGIIKPNTSVITHSDLNTEALQIISDAVHHQQSILSLTPKNNYDTLHDRNKALAKTTCQALLIHESIDAIMPPFGRLSLSDYYGVPCLFDVGHNVDAARAITESLSKPHHWILGMQEKKDYRGVIQFLLHHNQSIQWCDFDSNIALPYRQLPQSLNHQLSRWDFNDPIETDTIFFGSFFFIEALEKKKKSITIMSS